MVESLVPSIAIVALLGFMLWFALGTQRNIRTGERILHWLQDGLPSLGTRTTLRWLGSSVVELRIVDPAAPFRDAAVLVVLEPRDLFWLWALSRRRGRRDFLILRASLRRPPRVEVDIRDRTAWTRDGGPGGAIEADGASAEAATLDQETRTWASGNADVSHFRRAWTRFGSASGGAWRLSVQQVVPHLEVHVLPPALDAVPSRRLLEEFRELAVSMEEDRGRLART